MARLPTIVVYHIFGGTRTHRRRTLITQIIVLGSLIPSYIVTRVTVYPVLLGSGTPKLLSGTVLLVAGTVLLPLLARLVRAVVGIPPRLVVDPTIWLVGHTTTVRGLVEGLVGHERLVSALSHLDVAFKGIGELDDNGLADSIFQPIQVQVKGGVVIHSGSA